MRLAICRCGVPENRDARQSWDNLTQNLQPLRTEFRREYRQPRSVTAGSRQTGDKSRSNAVAGPIGFVGLVVPHLCRLLVGIDHRWLLPMSAIVGAALLTAADVVGRIVARPEEIDVGIITALLGAPVFIFIVRRQKVRAL